MGSHKERVEKLLGDVRMTFVEMNTAYYSAFPNGPITYLAKIGGRIMHNHA